MSQKVKFKTQIISIINQKGGVGKTTTVQNIADYLGRKNYKVLACDMDPQASLTIASAIDPNEEENVIFMMDTNHSFIKKRKYYDLIPASITLSEFDMHFSARMGREQSLKQLLEKYEDQYDFILIDCSPTLGLATINSLVASNKVLIPLQTEYYSMKGLSLIFDTIEQIKANDLNQNLDIFGIVLTLFDKRKRLHNDVKELITKNFGDILFDSVIRSNADLATAPSHFKSIFDYSPNSYGANDYKSLGNEIIKRIKKEDN